MSIRATATAGELANLLGVSIRTVRTHLPKLELDGKVTPIVRGSGQAATVYSVAEVVGSWPDLPRHKVQKREYRVVELLSDRHLVELGKFAVKAGLEDVCSWLAGHGYSISRRAVHRWMQSLQ